MNTSSDFFSLIDVQYSVSMPGTSIDILKGVSLSVHRGESVAICGRSGSGKSSLLNVMAGLVIPTSGGVYHQGQCVSRENEEGRANWRLQSLAFIFQSFELLDNLTVLENIQFPLELKKEKKAKECAMTYLEQVGLSERQNHFPLTLSGGEKQRVAIARAFALKPLILLADEPTGNLDENTGDTITELMFELNKNDTTLIIVTHAMALAKKADSLYHLHHGRLEKG